VSGLSAVIDLSGAPVDRREIAPIASAAVGLGSRGSVIRAKGPVAMGWLARHDDLTQPGDDQPVSDPEHDLQLVADARLDDREELWSKVAPADRGRGPPPPDSRLILGAYRRWGTECVPHLLGDFAFVLYDGRLRRVLAARDHAGTRPLHAARTGRRLLLASDCRQLLAHPGVSCRLDETTLVRFLAGLHREDDRSFYLDVRRVAPGHLLLADHRGARSLRWWDPRLRPLIRHRNPSDYAAECQQILRRAVRDRLRGVGPVAGVFVSGGLDSGAVAAVAAAEAAERGGPRVAGASLSFDRLAECDERKYSRLLTAERGIPVDFVPTESHLLFDPLDGCRPGIDTPLHGWEGAFGALRAALAARGARFVLTGFASAYGSLDHDRLAYAPRLLHRPVEVTREVRRRGRELGLSGRRTFESYFLKPLLPPALLALGRRLRGHGSIPSIPSWIDPGAACRAGLAEIARSPWPLVRLLTPDSVSNRARFRELGSVGAAVCRLDGVMAAAGTELRHPLLDRRLMEFFARLPPEQVFRAGWSKLILRRATAGLLPEGIRRRRDKTIFGAYIVESRLALAGRRPETSVEFLELERRGFVRGAGVREAWRRFLASRVVDESLELALMAEAWLGENRGRIG
jgi:asparagine synthase (glutamine-hydrolysing)